MTPEEAAKFDADVREFTAEAKAMPRESLEVHYVNALLNWGLAQDECDRLRREVEELRARLAMGESR